MGGGGMTEHEVPTHVQAEDRVVLWFTFPQIVAMTAVCALGYGVYRYAPVGPSEVRTGLAVVFALFGIAMVVGKVGGRRLPVVVADLLRFGIGPRRYAGPASDLVRSEPPTPPQAIREGAAFGEVAAQEVQEPGAAHVQSARLVRKAQAPPQEESHVGLRATGRRGEPGRP